jgi:hypothetical protein
MVESAGVWPLNYQEIERVLVDYWFEDFNFAVFESDAGARELDIAILNCATSTVWICSAAMGDGDSVLFDGYHRVPPNPLSSYVSAGGNLLLLGVNPAEALRFFERPDADPALQQLPVVFSRTLTDTTYLPHWGVTHFGMARITDIIGATSVPAEQANRLRVAKALVPGYPDLPFDPLTLPDGPSQRGFGFYDRGIEIHAGMAEAIYAANSVTGPVIGVRRLKDPQTGGSTVYLGLHPWFVERPAFRELVRQILVSFGETPNP